MGQDVLITLLSVAVLLGYFAYTVVRRRSLKGALFDAEVTGTLGDTEVVGTAMLKERIQVHALQRGADSLVGVELVSTSMMSYQVTPIVMTREQAGKLASMLTAAAARP